MGATSRIGEGDKEGMKRTGGAKQNWTKGA